LGLCKRPRLHDLDRDFLAALFFLEYEVLLLAIFQDT